VETARDSEVYSSIFFNLKSFPLGPPLLRYSQVYPWPISWPGGSLKVKRSSKGSLIYRVIIPSTLPQGIALLFIWGRHSLFSKVSGLHIIGTEIAISMGMFFVSVSFFGQCRKRGI